METDGTGCEGIARDFIPKHTFVCEYKTSQVLKRSEVATEEQQHTINQMGCYTVDIKHPIPSHGQVTLDAT